MAVHNNGDGNGELNGLAARFIAETNAFLDQFWARPEVGWPLKCSSGKDPGAPHSLASTGAARPPVPDTETTIGLAAVPELVATLKRLHQPAFARGGRPSAAGDASEPGVYLILMLIPEEPPVPALDAVEKARRAYRVHSRGGRPSATNSPPPRGEVSPGSRAPRRVASAH